jgi:hypothetical protein
VDGSVGLAGDRVRPDDLLTISLVHSSTPAKDVEAIAMSERERALRAMHAHVRKVGWDFDDEHVIEKRVTDDDGLHIKLRVANTYLRPLPAYGTLLVHVMSGERVMVVDGNIAIRVGSYLDPSVPVGMVCRAPVVGKGGWAVEE